MGNYIFRGRGFKIVLGHRFLDRTPKYLEKRNGKMVTSWMKSLRNEPQKRRHSYIQALREADKGNYRPLIEFMKEKSR